MSSAPLLAIEDLQVGFDGETGRVRAVDGVSFSIAAGQTLGVVGESGCGKSVTAASILRLVPSPPGVMLGGEIRFDGRDILAMTREELAALRGREIAMVFQDPMTSLNPVFTVERQMGEVLSLRFGLGRQAAAERSIAMLRTVGMPDPEARLAVYPHELSGGMKQRVMIAMALLCEPRLLIADEPTTALDVTIQAQILELLLRLGDELGLAVLFITHDLGIVAAIADRALVMYAGEIVEEAPVERLLAAPEHPYTKALLASCPDAGAGDGRARLRAIGGTMPEPGDWPPGCRFAPRCPVAFARCAVEHPCAVARPGGRVACFLAEEERP